MVEVWVLGEMEWIKDEFKPNQACWAYPPSIAEWLELPDKDARHHDEKKEVEKKRKRNSEPLSLHRFQQPPLTVCMLSKICKPFSSFTFISAITRYDGTFDSASCCFKLLASQSIFLCPCVLSFTVSSHSFSKRFIIQENSLLSHFCLQLITTNYRGKKKSFHGFLYTLATIKHTVVNVLKIKYFHTYWK